MPKKSGSISNIKGATVFIDKNGDGIWNEGEVKGIADDSGVFSLSGKGAAFKGTLISTGGINMTTGLANTETFMAPKVTKVVNSLTTLVAQVAKDEGLSMGQAMSQVKDALGIKLNILSKDPAALAESGKAGSTAVTNALAALEVQKQIDTVLKLGASTLSGAAAGTDATSLKTGLLSALVEKVVSGAPLDLTSGTLIQSVLTTAAASAGLSATDIAKVTTLAADAASVITASTAKIAESIAAVTELGKGATTAALDAALTNVVNVETVAATVSGALQSGAAGGSLTSVVDSYTGSKLDEVVATPPAPPTTGPVVVPPVTPVVPSDPSPPAATFSVTKDSTTPTTASDADTNHLWSASDTLKIKFSTAIDATKIAITDLALSNTHSFGTGATLAPITGTATEFTITLGTSPTMVKGDAITIDKAKLVNASGTAATAGVTFDVSGVESVAPDAVDLAATADVQATATVTVNATEAAAGKVIASAIQAPSATDIATIKIVMGGVDTTNDNDKLVLDADKALSADFSSEDPQTINSITGLSYTYKAETKTLLITKSDGIALTAADIDNIVAGIKFKTAADATQGARTATISYIDLQGNVGTSAAVTLNIDTVKPATIITNAAYDENSNTITLTGTDFNTLLESGESASTDIKGRLDWTKLEWDIDGDGTSTTNVTFTLANIASAEAINDTTLTIKLTDAKGAALEAAPSYGAAVVDDTLIVATGFPRDISGNVATTEGFVDNNKIVITADTTPPTATVTTATIGQSGNASVQSTETGTAYLVHTGVTVSNLASITSADDNQWNWVSITAASTPTNLAATGLASGSYKVYAVDATANLSLASTNIVTVDATAPTISTVSIPNAAMKIGDVITATITVSNATGETLTLKDGSTIGGFALGSLAKTNDTTYTATFTVAAAGTDVAASSTVPVSITLVDPAGNESTPFTAAIAQDFDAIDANVPTLSSSTPADNASNVAADSSIVLTFNENVAQGTSGTIKIFKAGSPATEVVSFDVSSDINANVTFSEATVTISPSADLALGAAYYVEISAGAIVDAAGNPHAGITDNVTLNFNTANLVITNATGDGDAINAAFAAYEGTAATVNGTGMDTAKLTAILNGQNLAKVATGGISNLTLTGAQFTALANAEALDKIANGNVAFTTDALSDTAQIIAIVNNIDKVAALGIKGEINLNAAQFAATNLAGKLDAGKAIVDAASADATLLGVLSSNIDKVKAGGISNLSLILNAVDDAATNALLGKATEATVVATGATATAVGHLVTHIANIAAHGITGDLTINKDSASLLPKYSGTAATVDAAGADGAQNQFIINAITAAKIAADGLKNLSLSADSFASLNQWHFAKLHAAIADQGANAMTVSTDGSVSINATDYTKGLKLNGSTGVDPITGGGSDDVIDGGDGGDYITAGGGNDTITGGNGNDWFLFASSASLNGADTITDFTTGSDTLNLTAFGDAVVNVTAPALTTTAKQVYVLSGVTAGSADTVTAVAAALNNATTWTDANATAWVIVSDDNSAAIYEWADTAGSNNGVGVAELTLVGTITGTVVATDVFAVPD